MGYFCNFIAAILLLAVPQISAVGFPINVWPKPATFQWRSPQAILLSPNFSISAPPHRYLTPAVGRYLRLVLTEHHRPLVNPPLNVTSASPLSALTIDVSDTGAPLTHGADESYSLSVPCDGGAATIRAETAWGAMRGLETFSQLVYSPSPPSSKVACGMHISDAPLFVHRGIMLDTSRNFYGVEHLLRLIGAMSMNKLNVFHWHITDSHSFPLAVPSEPDLPSKGAYGDEMTYTAADVKKIVDYGMEHGVRVLPEIDMPAHTGSWAGAYPDIVTCANMFWWPAGESAPYAAEPGTGQLNPMNPKTFEIVKNVVRDAVSMFPEKLYHGGADEVNPKCWETDPAIQAFLSNNGTLSQVLEKFIGSTLPYILSLNRTVVYWEDVLLDANVNVTASVLPPEHVILQTWNNGPNNTKKIVESGYRAIVSSSDFYYLDCGHGDFTGNNSLYIRPPGTDQGNGGSWCGPFKSWQLIYNYDITYGLNKTESKLVLGGEVALWSEQADPAVMDLRIWPRTSAMAETLWSGNLDETGKNRVAEATDRLNEWRYRMVTRGIGAEPIQPLWCIKNPGMCNNPI
ncbi:beta-hexosaminidase 2 [Andrographis paniculata]|uniref:beta-hexosaminidase 2 n=1 Tax=Andrographis paniculata TaxID=175694 RepID=UPI0021E8024E|nr:beta-hexosaminidase 2 [Andrographis paniculata]